MLLTKPDSNSKSKEQLLSQIKALISQRNTGIEEMEQIFTDDYIIILLNILESREKECCRLTLWVLQVLGISPKIIEKYIKMQVVETIAKLLIYLNFTLWEEIVCLIGCIAASNNSNRQKLQEHQILTLLFNIVEPMGSLTDSLAANIIWMGDCFYSNRPFLNDSLMKPLCAFINSLVSKHFVKFQDEIISFLSKICLCEEKNEIEIFINKPLINHMLQAASIEKYQLKIFQFISSLTSFNDTIELLVSCDCIQIMSSILKSTANSYLQRILVWGFSNMAFSAKLTSDSILSCHILDKVYQIVLSSEMVLRKECIYLISILCEVCTALQIATFASPVLDICTNLMMATDDTNILVQLLSIIKHCLQIGVGPSSMNKYAIQFENQGGLLLLNKHSNNENEIVFKEVNKIRTLFYDKPAESTYDSSMG